MGLFNRRKASHIPPREINVKVEEPCACQPPNHYLSDENTRNCSACHGTFKVTVKRKIPNPEYLKYAERYANRDQILNKSPEFPDPLRDAEIKSWPHFKEIQEIKIEKDKIIEKVNKVTSKDDEALIEDANTSSIAFTQKINSLLPSFTDEETLEIDRYMTQINDAFILLANSIGLHKGNV